MKSRIRHISYVLNFLNVGFSSDDISHLLESEIGKVLRQMNHAQETDWEIHFRATYTNARSILISKNRFGSFKSDKYKEITIAIPIPVKDAVVWGVGKDQHVLKKSHYDKLEKNFHALPANFQHENRNNYILDCMRRAISFCFEKGFTVNGVKFKKD